MRKITTFFAVVRGARCLQIETLAFFGVACFTVGTMATLVIRLGVLSWLIIQEMRACLSTERDIGSRTHTANNQTQMQAEKNMEYLLSYLSHPTWSPVLFGIILLQESYLITIKTARIVPKRRLCFSSLMSIG